MTIINLGFACNTHKRVGNILNRRRASAKYHLDTNNYDYFQDRERKFILIPRTPLGKFQCSNLVSTSRFWWGDNLLHVKYLWFNCHWLFFRLCSFFWLKFIWHFLILILPLQLYYQLLLLKGSLQCTVDILNLTRTPVCTIREWRAAYLSDGHVNVAELK